MVFQNPYASLNPRRRVRDMILDAYEIHGIARGRDADSRMAALMENVGLRPNMLDRYPHQFSSGQRQRVGIARALSVDPTLVVADEPVSALDVSVQAQVLNLIRGLQLKLGLAVIFISHDLRAVSFLCERIGVLYLGQMMEMAPRKTLVEQPIHPYTRALFSSIPSLTPGRGVTRELIRGEISDEDPPPGGCVFAPRCELRRRLGNPEICLTQRPPLMVIGPGHGAACHFADQVAAEPPPAAALPLDAA
jgi:oligopeptide/dipeptide ABC transporter ATP-binding protein